MSRPYWNRDWVETTACVESPSVDNARFFIGLRLGFAGIFGGWRGIYAPNCFPLAERIANDALDFYLSLHGLPTGTYTIRKGYYGRGYKSLEVEPPGGRGVWASNTG